MSASAQEGRLVEDGARGVARVAQEEHLGARRDGRLDGRRVEREAAIGMRGHVDRAAAVEDDRRQVGHVRRLVEDDLVAGVDEGRHGRRDRLRRADGDEQLAFRVVLDPVQPRQVLGQRAAQLERAVVARVVGPPGPSERTPSSMIWGGVVKSGSPTPEADDVGHRGDDVEELADARRRHGGHAPGQARGGPDGGLGGHDGPSIRAGRPLIVPAPGRRGAPRPGVWPDRPGPAGRPAPGCARGRRP